MDWRSQASIEVLQQRAELMRRIRQFFYDRKVLEVDTPALSQRGVTDCHLENLVTTLSADATGQALELFLQTSPEYAMKRLLAQYKTSIYQLSHVFRDDEIGRHHNPEFMMLEWYRIGFSMNDLIAEVAELLTDCINAPATDIITYQQAFLEHTQCDPLTAAGRDALHQRLKQRDDTASWMQAETDTDTMLQLAFYLWVEPNLPADRPVAITHFPATQAALARLSETDDRVALRFEIYYQGIELANGYDELIDSAVQAQRFAQDNELRQAHSKLMKAPDERLLAALEHGMPTCAGVALGFDRLLMIATGADHIAQVQPFSVANC